jgi:hypothetical protein
MAAFEAAVEVVLGAVRDAPGSAGSPMERFQSGLRAYLDALAADPALARVLLIEVYAAGPAALERRAVLQRGFVAAVDEAFGRRGFVNEALVAAISALVTARLAAGDIDGLRALHGPLVDFVRRIEDS